jgi:hypothetical protein
MNRPNTRDLAIFILLVTVGVVARVVFQEIPNFAPVAALALFAGYFFGHRLVAVAVPLAVMTISDRLVDAGGYAMPLMLTVYGLLALPVFFRGCLQQHLSLERSSIARSAGSVIGLLGCSLACSLIFFVGTNFMVWMTGSWYEPTFAGLMKCFAGAIPFFRYTLAGDAAFAVFFFGSHAFATSIFRSVDREDRLITAS